MTCARKLNENCPVTSPVYFFNEDMPLHSLAFVENENDGHLFCGREDGRISVWDLKTLRVGGSVPLCSGASQCINIKFCGEKLLTQDKTGLVKSWIKNGTWEEESSIKLDYYGFCKLDVNSELKLIACPFKKSSIQIYSWELTLLSSLEESESENKFGYIMGCKFVKCNGQYFLLVSYENGNLTLWDLQKEQPVTSISLCKSPPFTLDFDNSKSQGLCGTNSKKLLVFKLSESLLLENLHTIRLKSAGVGVVKIQPEKDIVAAGCWDSMIRIFSWTSFRLLLVLSFHLHSIEDMCFSSKKCEVLDSDCVLFAASRDKKVSLWSVSDII